MPLTPIADDLWGVEYDHFMGPLHFRTRMTVVRLADGLWLHSPVPIDDDLAQALEALGPVRWLVAPNGFHHSYLSDAARRWPDARVFVSPALRGKRPDLAEAADLAGPLPTEWGALQGLLVQGTPKFGEVVWLHRPSGSLIVTDLVTHVQQARTWLSRLFFRLEGIYGKPAHSPLWKWMTKDQAAFGQSLAQILAWPIARVVVAHGPVIEDADCPALLARLWAKPLGRAQISAPIPVATR